MSLCPHICDKRQNGSQTLGSTSNYRYLISCMYCNSDQMSVNDTYSLMPIRASKSWLMRKKIFLGCAASTLHYVLSYTTAFENVKALQDKNHPGKFHQTVLKSWVFWRLKFRFNAAPSILPFHPYQHRRLHCTQLIYCPGTHKSNVSFSVDKTTNPSVSLEPFRTPGTNRRCKRCFYIRSTKQNRGYRIIVSTIENSSD